MAAINSSAEHTLKEMTIIRKLRIEERSMKFKNEH